MAGLVDHKDAWEHRKRVRAKHTVGREGGHVVLSNGKDQADRRCPGMKVRGSQIPKVLRSRCVWRYGPSEHCEGMITSGIHRLAPKNQELHSNEHITWWK